MEKERIKKQLIDKLKIPISKIIYADQYLEIWINDIHIGNIPVIKSPVNMTPLFDTSDKVVNDFNWKGVVDCWKNEIKQAIEESLDKKYDLNLVSLPAFGYLVLKENEESEAVTVRVWFDGVKWNIKER